MSKASQNKTEFYEIGGDVKVWDLSVDEIVEALNSVENTSIPVLVILRRWIENYLRDGITELLLDQLNEKIKNIHYSRMVVPSDLRNYSVGQPKNIYLARMRNLKSPEVYAANDFAKLLTSGELGKLKNCNMEGCQKLFIGPPQKKWCSKACGAKHRMRKKRAANC